MYKAWNVLKQSVHIGRKKEKERIWGERERLPPTPERREEEEVGGIRGREGIGAVNSMIQNNIWFKLLDLDDLNKCRCQDDDGIEVHANLPSKVLSYVLLDIFSRGWCSNIYISVGRVSHLRAVAAELLLDAFLYDQLAYHTIVTHGAVGAPTCSQSLQRSQMETLKNTQQ